MRPEDSPAGHDWLKSYLEVNYAQELALLRYVFAREGRSSPFGAAYKNCVGVRIILAITKGMGMEWPTTGYPIALAIRRCQVNCPNIVEALGVSMAWGSFTNQLGLYRRLMGLIPRLESHKERGDLSAEDEVVLDRLLYLGKRAIPADENEHQTMLLDVRYSEASKLTATQYEGYLQNLPKMYPY